MSLITSYLIMMRYSIYVDVLMSLRQVLCRNKLHEPL